MEYRLNQEGSKNLKLFYKQNSYDWLEGYASEYGGGFIWRKKLESLKDIFRFKKPQTEISPLRPSATTTTTQSVQSDSVKVDSVNVKR